MLIPEVLKAGDPELAEARARIDLRAVADRDLARRSLVGIFSYFIVWLIIYYASELEHANDALLEFMGLALALAAIGRLYLVLNFAKLHAAHPASWRGLFCAGTIVSAAIWGGVGALAIDYDGLGTTAVMVILPTAAIAAGGIVSLAPAPRLGGIFIAVLLVPSMAVASMGASSAERGVALLFLVFLVVITALWRRLHREYWSALITRDDLVRAKEDAEAATLAKGQFIASVSHELRTPLTSVVSALGMIIEYPPDGMPSEAWVLVDMAYRNSKRLSVLVNDILDFEKLDARQMAFHFQHVDMAHFLSHAIELNEIYAERHSVSLVLEPVPVAVEVMVDENRLLQVMTNLISNAAKHSPPHDQVVIAARLHDGVVRVSVTDHGPGVPEEFRAHIFEKFAQAQPSPTHKKDGTGLGLAISKAIIEQMGGTMGFESIPGQGATFFFDLPVMAAPDNGQAAA